MKLLSLLSFSLLLLSANAQAGFQAKKLDPKVEALKIDGKLDESVWQNAVVYDRFYQTQPFDKVLAQVKTEVRVLYDDLYLYVGIKGFDKAPAEIRQSFSRRDRISSDQDFFALFIDPSGGHKAAQTFYVNARGTVMDGIYSDTSGEDTAPDYDFDVATARFEGGWSAEYRIPFSSVAYDKHSTTPWSLLVMRNMTRDQRYRMYSGEVTRATNCNLCFSDVIEGMQELPSGLNWSATPQLVMRSSSDQSLGSSEQKDHGIKPSLDLKFRPDSATTIDATFQPDFSQIELDSPQLSGNTLFSIYVPEKRPFFLEGADIFRTPFNAISTRTIAAPDLGLRFTRRDAEKDVSILVARDESGATVSIPHTYYTGSAITTVASIATDARANFRMGSLSLGTIATDRTYAQGSGYNRVAGADMVWQIDRNQLLRSQVLLSASTAQLNEQGNIAMGKLSTGHAAYLGWSNGNDDWGMAVGVRDLSKDFRDDNGFFSQVGFQSVNTDMSRKLGRIGMWNEFNLVVSGEYKLDSEGNILSKNVSPGVRVTGAYDSFWYLSATQNAKNRVTENGELFTTSRVFSGLSLSPSKEIARIGADFSFGDIIDVTSNRVGKGAAYSIGAKIRPVDRIELEPSYATSWINNADELHMGERAYTETAIQINSIIHLSSKDTVRMILQDAHTVRNPDLYNIAVAPESSRSVNSLVYTRTTGLGSATYLGWTTTKSDTPGFVAKRKQSELFAKLSWQI